MKKTLSIPSISCGHCVKTIERELKTVEGVEFIQGSIETKAIMIDYASEEALASARATLQEIGYAPVN